MEKREVRIITRFGVSNKKKGPVYDAVENFAVAKFRKILEDNKDAIEREVLAGKGDFIKETVVAAIEKDLALFAGKVRTWLFAQAASTKGKDSFLSLQNVASNDLQGTIGGLKMISSIASRVDTSSTLRWAALAARTVRHKRSEATNNGKSRPGSMLFFVDTSELRAALSGTVMAKIFEAAFNPSVSFKPIRDPQNYKAKRLGTIKVKLWSGRNLSTALAPALTSGNWTLATEDQTLMKLYVKTQIGDEFYKKFTGPRQAPQNRRPWLGPMMAFWVIDRAPKIVAIAVANAINKR